MFWSIKVQAKFKQSFKEVFKLYLEHFRFFAGNDFGSKKYECLKLQSKKPCLSLQTETGYSQRPRKHKLLECILLPGFTGCILLPGFTGCTAKRGI